MLHRPDRRGPARPPAERDRHVPVRYALCYTALTGVHPPDRRVWREATCTDLFAYGAILLLDEELAPNTLLTLQLLPGEAPGDGLSRVSRLVRTEPGPEGGWLAGCEFPLLLGARDLARVRAAASPAADGVPSGPHAPLGRYGEQAGPRRRGSALFGPPHQP